MRCGEIEVGAQIRAPRLAGRWPGGWGRIEAERGDQLVVRPWLAGENRWDEDTHLIDRDQVVEVDPAGAIRARRQWIIRNRTPRDRRHRSWLLAWTWLRMRARRAVRRKLRYGLVNAVLVPHCLALLAVAELALLTLRLRASTDGEGWR